MEGFWERERRRLVRVCWEGGFRWAVSFCVVGLECEGGACM